MTNDCEIVTDVCAMPKSKIRRSQLSPASYSSKMTNSLYLIANKLYSQRLEQNFMPKRDYHNYWVYILTNKPDGVLYIGFTAGLDDRMERHSEGNGSFFTSKYRLKRLVYFEEFQYVEDAIKREKQLKNWRRDWKINLIEKENPNWDNLWERLDSETN